VQQQPAADPAKPAARAKGAAAPANAAASEVTCDYVTCGVPPPLPPPPPLF